MAAYPEDTQSASGVNLESYDGLTSRRASYDEDDRMEESWEPGAANYVTTYFYNSDGQVRRQENPDGSWSTHAYDLAGNETSVTRPRDDYNSSSAPYETATARTLYDVEGKVRCAIDAGCGETWLTYDRLGRVTVSRRPASSQSSTPGGDDMYTFTTTNSLGWKVHEYPGDLDGVSGADDTERKWWCRGDGSLVAETVGKGSSVMTTNWTYDDAGRLTMKYVATGGSDSRYALYTYDVIGRVTSEEQHEDGGSGDVVLRRTEFTYDGLGRVLTRDVEVRDLATGVLTPAIAESLSYAAQDPALGNASVTSERSIAMAPSEGSDPGDVTQTTKLDGRGREVVQSAAIPNPETPQQPLWSLSRTISGRDAADRITGVTAQPTSGETPGVNPASSTGTWSYNGCGQLLGQWGLGFEDDPQGSFAYASSGKRKEARLYPLDTWQIIEEKYRYYDDGRVKKGGAIGVADDGTYTYNAHGDMKTATLGSATRTFHYGPKHRVDWTQVDDGDRIYYGWDAAFGRRTGTGVGEQVGGAWQAPTIYPITYQYDGAGKLTLYDNQTDPAHKRKAEYRYDADGLRIRAKLTEDYNLPAANQVVTYTDYLYDRGQLVGLKIWKTNGSGTPLANSAWQILYFYDAAGTPYAGLHRRLTDGVTHTFFLVTNDRGDVLALMDGDHEPFASYRYDVYGRPTDASSQASSAMTAAWAELISEQNVLRYASYCYDLHSSLYYLQQRYYDPITRQFISQDPLKSDGDESPYQYCGGCPIVAVDPDGEQVLYKGDSSSNSNLTKKERAQLNAMTAQAYFSSAAAAASAYANGSYGVAAVGPRIVLAPALVKVLTAYKRAVPVSAGAGISSSPEPEHSHNPSEEQVHNEEIPLNEDWSRGRGPQHPVPVERSNPLPEVTPWWRSGDQPAFANEGEAIQYYLFKRPSGVPLNQLVMQSGAPTQGVPSCGHPVRIRGPVYRPVQVRVPVYRPVQVRVPVFLRLLTSPFAL